MSASPRESAREESSRATCDAGELVRRRLLDLGFHRVGFARAGVAPAGERFRDWISRRFHGEMEYLARDVERRLQPERVLPSTRTVIVVALHYRPPDAPPDGGGPGGAEISAYARGTDYHRVLERRLKTACRSLAEEHPEERFRYYVDTGPVLEKAWAERAGVGWIGKNTCSIDPSAGSYFFLGVILTTLEVPEDEPARDHCGSCRLCLDACPTGAFPEPYVLDARRCISYLTIEHRGEIPPPREPGLGRLVFGCDICQQVCPWNRGRGPEPDPELEPRPENESPRLSDLADLDEETFRERFARSAVRRAKFPGFLRNVIVAIGNSSDRRALAILERLAEREDVRRDPTLRATLERSRARLEDPPD